ncbi:MAG: redoxin family protein [Planctomycetota bacterium]
MTHRLPSRWFSRFALAGAIGLASPGLADTMTDNGQAAFDGIVAAYRAADDLAYRADVALQADEGRWTTVNATHYDVAWDADGQRLRIAHPAFDLQVQDGVLEATADSVPGVALRAPLGGPTSWDALVQAFPPLASMLPMPELVLLTAEEPLDAFAGQAAPAEPTLDDDGGVVIVSDGQPVTLTSDPATGLLTRAVGEATGPMGQPVRLEHQYTEIDPADAGLEPFVIGDDARVVDDFMAYVGAARGPEPGAAMVGQPAPDVTFTDMDGNTVRLADMADKVVVLDFWTTWCGPCIIGMPELIDFQEWAEAEGKEVAVFAVNVAESEPQIEAAVQQNGWESLSVLRDDGRAHLAMGGQGFPYSVVIADGEIVKAQMGFIPGRYTDSLIKAVGPYVD